MIPISALLSSEKSEIKALSDDEVDDDDNSASGSKSGVMFGVLMGGVVTLLMT